jgi:hypothetical protein
MDIDEARTLKLGERVHYNGRLQRISAYPDKVWVVVPTEGDGIVIGRRTYSNGHTVDDGEVTEYIPDERFPVVLVAHALHRSPVAVPADQLDRSDGTSRGSRHTAAYEGEALFALEDFS